MSTQIVEYSKTEAALAVLSEKYKTAVFDTSTTKGLAAAKEARAEIRGYRTALENMRKEIKAPALERCRLIDDEAKRITTALLELEMPIDTVIKAEEKRKEAEREAKAEAERKRIAAIHMKIIQIRSYPVNASPLASAGVVALRETLSTIEIDASFAEFHGEAMIAKNDALNVLDSLIASKREAEAEAARIKAEREELERLQAAQRKREAEEEAQRAQAKRKQEAEEKAARDRIEAAERESRAKIEAAEREARLKREAEEREHQKRIDEENRKIRAAREAEEAKLKAERDELERKQRAEREAAEAKQREIEREKNRRLDAAEMLRTFRTNFGDMSEFSAITFAIDAYFEQSKQQAA